MGAISICSIVSANSRPSIPIECTPSASAPGNGHDTSPNRERKNGGPSPRPRKSSSVKDALRLGQAYVSQMNAPHSTGGQCFSIHKIAMGLVFDRKGTLFAGASLYSPIRPIHLMSGVMP